jgi:glycine cleavage system H protein
MPDLLETTVDKFTFRVATDRLYTTDHLWAKWEEGLVRVGVSDYLQQTSGDLAFAEIKPEGTALARSDELASIETMKTNLIIPAPLNGVIKLVNEALVDAPELVNQDPYGEGWLAMVEPDDWAAAQAGLLEAAIYFEQMRAEAETEVRKV